MRDRKVIEGECPRAYQIEGNSMEENKCLSLLMLEVLLDIRDKVGQKFIDDRCPK